MSLRSERPVRELGTGASCSSRERRRPFTSKREFACPRLFCPKLVAHPPFFLPRRSGLSHSIVSLVAPTPDFSLSRLLADDEQKQALPGLPSSPKKLPFLSPVKMEFTSSYGNITAAYQNHVYHVPLQLNINSNGGSVGGSFHAALLSPPSSRRANSSFRRSVRFVQ